jgi:hypothetical protein
VKVGKAPPIVPPLEVLSPQAMLAVNEAGVSALLGEVMVAIVPEIVFPTMDGFPQAMEYPAVTVITGVGTTVTVNGGEFETTALLLLTS